MKSKKLKSLTTTVMLICCLILTMTNGAFASDSAQEIQGPIISVSEYEIVKNLTSKSNVQLKKEGYTIKDIEEINSIDFGKLANEMRHTDVETLKARGVSEEEIYIIKNSPNDEAVLRASMGDVTYNISYSNFKYTSSSTSVTTKAHWNWTKAPVSQFTDIIASSTNMGMIAETQTGVAYYYKNGIKGGSANMKYLTPFTKGETKVSALRIPMCESRVDTGDIRPSNYVALMGDLTTNWVYGQKVTKVGLACNYGHSKISLTPTVSISNGGVSIGFSPSLNITQGDESSIVAS